MYFGPVLVMVTKQQWLQNLTQNDAQFTEFNDLDIHTPLSVV